MCLASAKVFFFFYPHRNCFYLSKREHALLSSENVFVKFHVVFPWLSGEGFGAKIIHAIEQAEKKNPKESKCICPLFQPAKGEVLTPPAPLLNCLEIEVT